MPTYTYVLPAGYSSNDDRKLIVPLAPNEHLVSTTIGDGSVLSACLDNESAAITDPYIQFRLYFVKNPTTTGGYVSSKNFNFTGEMSSTNSLSIIAEPYTVNWSVPLSALEYLLYVVIMSTKDTNYPRYYNIKTLTPLTITVVTERGSYINSGYYNGTKYEPTVPYYYNGTAWIPCEWKRYNGTSWDDIDTK